MIRNGVLPAAKIGRAWVMLQRDVPAYVEQQIIKQTAERLGVPIGRGTRRRRRPLPDLSR